MPKVINRGCEHCGGDLFDVTDDYDNTTLECYQCGRPSRFTREAFGQTAVAVAEKRPAIEHHKPATEPKRMGRPSKYDEYMDAILFDYGHMNPADLAKKWGMPRSYIYHLKKLWKARGIVITVGYMEKANDNHKDAT